MGRAGTLTGAQSVCRFARSSLSRGYPLVFLVFLGVTAAAPAQPVHTEVDAAGHLLLTNADAQPSSAGRVKVVFHRTADADGRVSYGQQPDTTTAVARRTTVSPGDVARALAGSTTIASPAAQVIDANEAKRRLGQAQQERRLGLAMLPGEKDQLVVPDGKKDRYQRRQEKLERAVDDAQRRSGDTRR
jgi:hypothetical protein